MATIIPASQGARVVTVDDATITGQVVCNPDGSTIGGGSLPPGAATSANQTTQITAEQAIQAGVGATADAATTAGGAGSLSSKLRLATTQLASIISNTASYVLSAGTAIIGKVGIDQTTPGTTNKVSIGTDGTVSVTGVSTSAKQDTLLAAITKVGAVTVVGITEVDAYTTGATSSHTVVAGSLAIAVNFSSDFTGTVQGSTYTAANQGVALARVAQPGNLLPALAITRSAGSYDYYVVTPV